MAQNISKVYLLKTPLESDMKNTLYFSSVSAKENYFNSQISKTYNNVSYQSETRTFRCPDQIDTVRQHNYIMWQNPAYSNKWFYGFIKRAIFVSDGFTDIEFEVDPLQTFLFDVTMMPSFVEREHTRDDTVGANTIPEGFELGDYVKNSGTGTPQIGPDEMWYAVGVSDIIGSMTNYPASMVNGLPNGLYYIFTNSVSTLHRIVQIYDIAGKANAIYSMFVFPKMLLYVRQGDSGTWGYKSSTWNYSNGSFSTSFDISVPTSTNMVGTLVENYEIVLPDTVGVSYRPRNKKLLTFPYCYFNISNNSGQTVTYRYEDFNGKPKFNLHGVLNAGCSTKLYPTNYKNMQFFNGTLTDNPYDYGVTGGKYPTVSWNSDSYTNWLTQNAVNIGMGAMNTTLATVGSMAVGNVAGSTLSFIGGVSNAVSEFYKASLMPDTAKGNTNVGDLNFTAHKNKFTVFELSIKPEYARVIDDYFDLFGYKTNRLKLPNIAHRANWWYTKTINANIIGDIPNEYMDKIKEAYNNGITFWRNPSNFLDYSVNNGVV